MYIRNTLAFVLLHIQIKQAAFMVQSQLQHQSGGGLASVHPATPTLIHSSLFICPGCKKVETELCVLISHLQLCCSRHPNR